MGSACCVPAKDKTSSKTSGREAPHRNVLYSPSCSVQMDNREHAMVEMQGPCQLPRGVSWRGGFGFERGNHSDGICELENFRTPVSQKSLDQDEMVQNAATLPSDLSSADNHSTEAKSFTPSPEVTGSCPPKLSFSIPSTTLSTPARDTFPFHALTSTAGSTPSRRGRRSPGHQLTRHVSDSRILGLKSPTSYSVSEGRPSFVLSACSNDLTPGSQACSLDGWSMRTFSELVASSQRERWSFDSETFGSGHSKICGSSSRFSCSPSTDLRACGACSKLLTERSSWVSSNEISVVAVLACGHSYHADCLETMTLEANKYDPACPICTVGEKQASKMSKRSSRGGDFEPKGKNNKVSRNRVADSFFDSCKDAREYSRVTDPKGKVPRMEPCSSMRSSSFVKPFLRRHFSLGSKWSRSLSASENDSPRKKFWGRHRKE